MTRRRYFLDRGPGESRGVVLLGERAERLIIVRDHDLPVQALGAFLVGRVARVERQLGLAFVDLGRGPEAVLNLARDIGSVREGGFVEVEVRSEASAGKGARLRWLAEAQGPVRLLTEGPDLETRLHALAKGAAIETGAAARRVADAAQEEALETVFSLAGGGSIAVEPTRALIAVDVDVGSRSGGVGKKADRSANLLALAESARVLRLKGLGGLVVIDLAGRGHDGAALLAAARSAFAPDNPGVALGPVSRFGTLELTIPRRARPALEILAGKGRSLTAETQAMMLLRGLEREAMADPGGRFMAGAAPEIAAAAAAHMTALTDRFGARLVLAHEPGCIGFEIGRA